MGDLKYGKFRTIPYDFKDQLCIILLLYCYYYFAYTNSKKCTWLWCCFSTTSSAFTYNMFSITHLEIASCEFVCFFFLRFLLTFFLIPRQKLNSRNKKKIKQLPIRNSICAFFILVVNFNEKFKLLGNLWSKRQIKSTDIIIICVWANAPLNKW